VYRAEEPHAPQILEDDMSDVRGAYAGPFNEGEELKLQCQVHGGRHSHVYVVYFYCNFYAVSRRPNLTGMRWVTGSELGNGMLSWLWGVVL
jgi:hypothetical protein